GAAPDDGAVACWESSESTDAGYADRARRLVRDVVADGAASTDERYVVTWPGADSGVGVHRVGAPDSGDGDLEVLVALDPATYHNGQIWVLPRSHRWPRTDADEFAADVAEAAGTRLSRLILMEAGDALVC